MKVYRKKHPKRSEAHRHQIPFRFYRIEAFNF